MDPLSDLLALLRPSATISSGFDAGGSWAVRFADQVGQIKCYRVLRGECWLAVDGIESPVRLCESAAFVLPRGLPFRMASDLAVEPIEAGSLFPPARAGGQVRVGSGGEFALVGARFAVAGAPSGLLHRLLPPILHLQTASEKAALSWSVERMMQELRENRPGSRLMAQDLSHMLLLQALRAYLEQSASGDRGWLAALADKQLRLAVHAIHADPARRWTLKDLGAAPDGKPIRIMKGKFGAYASDGETNATLPEGTEPDSVTMEQALALIAERAAKGGKKKKAVKAKAPAKPKAEKPKAAKPAKKAAPKKKAAAPKTTKTTKTKKAAASKGKSSGSGKKAQEPEMAGE